MYQAHTNTYIYIYIYIHVSIPGFLGAGDSRCKNLLRHVDRCLRRHLAPRDDRKSPEIV